MEKLLKIFSVVFFLFGFVLVALGTGLALAAGQLAFLLFAAVGLVFFLVGVGMMAAISRARRLRRWLEENGRTIQADIIGVQYNPRVRLNGRCSFVLQCQAVNPADGKVYVFESDSLWFDPTPFLDGQTTMPVLVDPDDYHRYQMLTEGILPEKG